MANFLLNESLDTTFLQINDLGNKSEHYVSSHKFNLFQQFFVIGLDPKVLYNINEIEITTLPSQFLEPKIISKYPNTTLSYLCIPDTIIASHCFPNGLKNKILKSEKKEQIKEEIFIFSIENQGYEDKESSLRTRRVYYTCYFFYENIEDYRECITLRKNLKDKNNELNKNYYIPKVICLSSFIPLYQQTTTILKNLKQYVDKYSYKNYCKDNNTGKNLIPIEKIIEGLIFNIPGLPRTKYTIRITNDTFDIPNSSEKSKNDNNEKNPPINYPKEVVFSRSPINKVPAPKIDFSQLMYFFQIDDIFEIIKWIILEVPVLFFCENLKDLTYTVEGIVSLLYPFEYSYPIISILPEINYPLISIMKHFIFGINYKYTKEIFSQKGINIQNQNLLIVVKIEKRFKEIINFREKDKLNNSPIIVLKSDKNRPVLKLDQLNSYYNENNQQEIKKIEQGNAKKQKIALPVHQKEKLKKKFMDNIDLKVKEICYNQKRKKLTNYEYNKIISGELCETIFNFFVSLLLHYQQHCFKLVKKKANKGEKTMDKNSFYKYYEKDDIIEQKYNENKIEINDIFNVNDFLNTITQNDKFFYIHFLSTKLFFNFMMKKIFPVSVQDKLDVLFFDEKINEKQAKDSGNKKFVSHFLKNEFSNMKENIVLSTFRKPISQDYTEFLLSQSNQFRALNYFQYITKIENKNVTKEEENPDDDINDVSFNYFVFPKLLNDDIFYKEEFTIEKFWAPERDIFTSANSNCIFNQFEKEGQLIINNPDMVQKYNDYNYSLNLVSTFNVKMKDYIHLLWLQYFAKTFHYTPLSERKIQFDQMMSILKTMQIVDKNSINILFWIINKYGDRNMNQDLFINLKNKTYITFLALREKIKDQNNFIRYNDNMELSEEEKNEKLKNKSLMLFDENSNCENTSCNEQYNVQMKFLFNESISRNDNFVKFKCEKCKTEQYIWVKSVYDNGLGKGININFRLISPLALLKRKWFQDQLDLDLYYISKEHLEPYMSAMFYFYLQCIYCGFMIPPRKKNIQYDIEQNSVCYLENTIIDKSKDKTKNKIINTLYSNEKNISSYVKKKELGKIEKIEIVNNNKKKETKKPQLKKNLTLGKSVSQNYLKTINSKKKIKQTNYITMNRNIITGRNIKQRTLNDDKKLLKSVDLGENQVDLDISGESKGLFEYRGDSKNTRKNPFKKKAPVISIKNKMLIKNDSGLLYSRNSNNSGLLNTQNSYEYFKNKKKEISTKKLKNKK